MTAQPEYTVTNAAGEKVENCYVLTPATDDHAWDALWYYAQATDDIDLARYLIGWLTAIRLGGES
jgi:hypothetical protein